MTTPAIRIATDSDLRFVRSSWHSNYWTAWAGKNNKMPREAYVGNQSRRIERLLKRSTVLVAYFEDVPDEVLGWACVEGGGTIVHYVYVKAAYRRSGIASGLLAGKAEWFSHSSNETGKFFMRKVGAQFNPYLAEQ